MTTLTVLNVYTHPCRMNNRPQPAMSIDLHPTNPKRFVTGGADNNAYVWELDESQQGSNLTDTAF